MVRQRRKDKHGGRGKHVTLTIGLLAEFSMTVFISLYHSNIQWKWARELGPVLFFKKRKYCIVLHDCVFVCTIYCNQVFYFPFLKVCIKRIECCRDLC